MASIQIADGVYKVGSETKLQDGVWKEQSSSYLIESEAKLASITGAEPGSMAHTAGWKHVWELGTDGTTWEQIC